MVGYRHLLLTVAFDLWEEQALPLQARPHLGREGRHNMRMRKQQRGTAAPLGRL